MDDLKPETFFDRAFRSTEVVLHRFAAPNGKTYAIGKDYKPGTSYVKGLWYMDEHYKKIRLKMAHVVEVERIYARGGHPRVHVLADDRDPHVRQFEATIWMPKKITYSGHYLKGYEKNALDRSRHALARKANLSWAQMNSYIKNHPTQFQFIA